jgi:starvation-inducible DNA-binding protein
LEETYRDFPGRNADTMFSAMQAMRPSGLTGKARETLARILDHVLADECSLSATTRDYRWSVTGPNLYSLHRLFDEQRRQLDYWLGQIFERTRAVGIAVFGDLEKTSREGTPVVEHPGLPPRSMIGDLLGRHEEMARRLRDELGGVADPATTDLLRHLLDFHETSAWMLRMLHDGPSTVYS